MLEKCNKPLQCNTTTEEPTSQIKDKLGSSISTDFNIIHIKIVNIKQRPLAYTVFPDCLAFPK